MTVRLLGPCVKAFHQTIQEFARIIFVDDINNYARSFADQRPLKYRPAFESLDVPKTVSKSNHSFVNWKRMKIICYYFKVLNEHVSHCTKPGRSCIATLQQKQLDSWVGGNLRHVPAKVIPFRFKLSFSETDRSGNYLSEFHN